MRPQTLFAFVIAVFLGCSLAPWRTASAQPVADVRGVPYLTMRNKTGSTDPATFYGEGRSTLKAGYCDVREINLGVLSSAAQAAPFGIADDLLRVTRIRELPVTTVLDAFEARTDGSVPVLYTHGFYIDFEKGCRRATVLQENTGLEGQFLWFSWPSDGAIFNYPRDESDLYWSVPDLAEVIIDMESRFGPGNFSLAGHSLGARGIMLALYDISSVKPDLRVGDVALIAGDIDFGVFEKILPRIRPLMRSLTIYTSDADRPLALSAQVHGYPRLGQSGNVVPNIPDVDVVDISQLSVTSPSGHLYHIYSDEVGRDVGALLGEGKRAAVRDNLRQTTTNHWMLEPDG